MDATSFVPVVTEIADAILPHVAPKANQAAAVAAVNSTITGLATMVSGIIALVAALKAAPTTTLPS